MLSIGCLSWINILKTTMCLTSIPSYVPPRRVDTPLQHVYVSHMKIFWLMFTTFTPVMLTRKRHTMSMTCHVVYTLLLLKPVCTQSKSCLEASLLIAGQQCLES